jgi:hypothetical protein
VIRQRGVFEEYNMAHEQTHGITVYFTIPHKVKTVKKTSAEEYQQLKPGWYFLNRMTPKPALSLCGHK